MPSLQELLEIALRYATAMADAMIVACYQKAHEVGVRLVRPKAGRSPRPSARGRDPRLPLQEEGEPDWRRLMERNGDTRANHL